MTLDGLYVTDGRPAALEDRNLGYAWLNLTRIPGNLQMSVLLLGRVIFFGVPEHFARGGE